MLNLMLIILFGIIQFEFDGNITLQPKKGWTFTFPSASNCCRCQWVECKFMTFRFDFFWQIQQIYIQINVTVELVVISIHCTFDSNQLFVIKINSTHFLGNLLFHCDFSSFICLQTESGMSFKKKIGCWTIQLVQTVCQFHKLLSPMLKWQREKENKFLSWKCHHRFFFKYIHFICF